MNQPAQDFDVRVRRKIHEYAIDGSNRKPTRLYVGRKEVMERGGMLDFYNDLKVFVVNAESHLEVG